jgi:hypothetical protein
MIIYYELEKNQKVIHIYLKLEKLTQCKTRIQFNYYQIKKNLCSAIFKQEKIDYKKEVTL